MWLVKVFTALKYGNSLENPQNWKKFQSIFNIFAILTPTISIFYPQLTLTPEQAETILATIAGLNVYFTQSTSDKVGL